jgi:hypothetical protein
MEIEQTRNIKLALHGAQSLHQVPRKCPDLEENAKAPGDAETDPIPSAGRGPQK